jgi:hypothetical protein
MPGRPDREQQRFRPDPPTDQRPRFPESHSVTASLGKQPAGVEQGLNLGAFAPGAHGAVGAAEADEPARLGQSAAGQALRRLQPLRVGAQAAPAQDLSEGTSSTLALKQLARSAADQLHVGLGQLLGRWQRKRRLAGHFHRTQGLFVAECGEGDRERRGCRSAARRCDVPALIFLPRKGAQRQLLIGRRAKCRSTEARPAPRSRHPLRPALLPARR